MGLFGAPAHCVKFPPTHTQTGSCCCSGGKIASAAALDPGQMEGPAMWAGQFHLGHGRRTLLVGKVLLPPSG